MKETLIVTGGIVDKEFVEKHIKNKSFKNIIAVDKGLEVLYSLEISPTHIIGDFDSVKREILIKYRNTSIPIYKLKTEKNNTDTDKALEIAIELGSTDISILGAMGTRLDHTISNIHIMKKALDKNINCKMLDKNNEINLIDKRLDLERDERYKYISLIPLTEIVEGVNLTGFKYNLKDGNFKIGESIGISNEQTSNIASIQIKKGILIVIKSID